jgi:hypothetical protein
MFEMFQSVLALVLPLLGTAGAGLLVWLLKNKFKLQITAEQEKILAEILHKALGFANEWAHQQAKMKLPVSSEAKLEQAVAFTKTELARNKIKIPDAQVNDMLHAALGTMRGGG